MNSPARLTRPTRPSSSPAQKFVPQFGDFCAWATSQGCKADIDPHAFAINEHKLYMNFADVFSGEFQQDVKDNTAQAEANWTTVGALTNVTR